MNTSFRNFWQTVMGQKAAPAPVVEPPEPAVPAAAPPVLALDLAPNDPLGAYFQSAPGAVEVDKLRLASPTLERLKRDGVRIAIPLLAQGNLIGLLNLGPRRSEQDYSSDDRGLLNNLSAQAAPAVRVAQLVRQQQREALERERIEQELRVARLIQQTLLPRKLPNLPGWSVARHYQPARAVGGDFYDFIHLPDGRLGVIIGDVTDKGVPAALVMATTRAILRGAASRLLSPGEVLQNANELLCPDMPPNMFVTCLYTILDLATGRLHFANAGHNLPCRRHLAGVDELRATGMPLGLLPGMTYEERETDLEPGDSLLLYSDGLIEAHNPRRQMFSYPRLIELLRGHTFAKQKYFAEQKYGGPTLIEHLLERLAAFTGPEWEQEDDITLVVLQRSTGDEREDRSLKADRWPALAQFSLPSELGNERQAVRQVVEAVKDLNLPPARLEKLKTAVAEATMNAIEHGNKNRMELPVDVRVLSTETALAVQISDHGGGKPVPEPTTPDLDAKLAGLQSPRGWGLFLIAKMVDEMNTASDAVHHTIELILYLSGGQDAHPTA